MRLVRSLFCKRRHRIFEEPNPEVLESFRDLLSRHSRVYVVVSPPRCSSTAFARVLWEQPRIRYYCHEPFETTYYLDESLNEVLRKLESPLDLAKIRKVEVDADADALVIKEMPYQAGSNFPLLAAMADQPLVFLMRDPRLSIASRMRKKREVGDQPRFPKIESGWELWRQQIEWCKRRGVDYVLMDSTDFRNHPEASFSRVFERLRLPFSSDMLEWRACPEIELDNLGGRHRHLYGAVLASTGIRTETSATPPLEDFPLEDGWRDHVERCLAIYGEMCDSDARIVPGELESSVSQTGD